MYFLGLGVILLVLKYLLIEPVALWAWWQVLLPFGLAAAWWAWADSSGYTTRKAMEKQHARKQARIDKQREAMGLQGSNSGAYIKRKAMEQEAARQQALIDRKREAMGLQGSKKRR
jgi:small Trp-rich protein